MMEMATILEQFHDAFIDKYADRLLPGHLRAIQAMQRCRTPDSGEIHVHCNACGQANWRPLSCGHRSCPQCQNHEAGRWLNRQQAKLLPVHYFLVTFTLPYELRPLAWHFQVEVYNSLLACATTTLKDFGLNPNLLGAQMGMTAVLHTQTRKLDYHPHVHVVVPGGGIDKGRRQWKKVKGKYLFNEMALAKVFRARFLEMVNRAGLTIPTGAPKNWVVDCCHAGSGLPALKYLSRYLYRGVIAEKNIVSCRDGQVTYSYIESKTGQKRYHTLKGEDFLWQVLQHVLPKGFRRVRDYGFLHGNAKRLLAVVQLVLRMLMSTETQRPRPAFKCPNCKAPMTITAFRWPVWLSG